MSEVRLAIHQPEYGVVLTGPPDQADLGSEAYGVRKVLHSAFGRYVGMSGAPAETGQITQAHVDAVASPANEEAVLRHQHKMQNAASFCSDTTYVLAHPLEGVPGVAGYGEFTVTQTASGLCEAKIQEIDVRQLAQSAGIGTTILYEGVRHLADQIGTDSTVKLEVVRGNEEAEAWYSRLGFVATKKLKVGPLFPGAPDQISVEMAAELGQVEEALEGYSPWLRSAQTLNL